MHTDMLVLLVVHVYDALVCDRKEGGIVNQAVTVHSMDFQHGVKLL
jgi:hypothetical protein